MLAGVDPGATIDWSSLSLGVVDGIEFSLSAMVPGGALTRIGFADVPLADILKMMELHADFVSPILVGVINGGITGSLDPLRTAVEDAIDRIDEVANEAFVTLLKSPSLTVSNGFGANAKLGAEAVLSLGGGAKLEGKIKTSLLLLLLNRPEYAEEDGTVLASLSLPVNVGASAGASLGEGVEIEVSAGGGVSANLLT